MTVPPTNSTNNINGSLARMSTSNTSIPTSVNAAELLAHGKPFIEFPRYSILDIKQEAFADEKPGENGAPSQLDVPGQNTGEFEQAALGHFSGWLSARLQDGKPFVIQDFDKLPEWNQRLFSLEGLIEHSTKKNIPIRNCSTNRDLSFTLKKFADASRQSCREFRNLYARDLRCPDSWLEQCKRLLPPEVQWGGRLDLFQWLPSCARSEVMMAYVGSQGSSSGFHRCFSSTVALNLLVDHGDQPVLCFGTDFSSQQKYDNFMAARGASPHVDWLNLGPEDLKNANFPVYVCEQWPGDLVVFPPATAHQVWNLGKVSTKVVWNILHPLSLDAGLHYVQPPFNRLCHPDVARSNLSLACAMLSLLRDDQPATIPPDLPLLTRLFNQMAKDETIDGRPATAVTLVPIPETAIATCNFCGTAIWNRHLRCNQCQDFDLCLMCYLSGRSCEHPSSYSWAEIVPQEVCSRVVQRAESILGYSISKSSEGSRIPDQRKTLGTAVNELMLARQSMAVKLCHLCRSDHLEWKGRRCDKCSAFFCYRGLYRHFDMASADVMRHPGLWICPKCLESCNCRCCHFASPYVKAEKPASKRRVRPGDPRGKNMGFTDNVFDQKKRNTPALPASPAFTSPPAVRSHKRPLSSSSTIQPSLLSAPPRRATASSITLPAFSAPDLADSPLLHGRRESTVEVVPDGTPHDRFKMRRTSVISRDTTPKPYSDIPPGKTLLGINYITQTTSSGDDQLSLPPLKGGGSYSSGPFTMTSPSTMSRKSMSNDGGMTALATLASTREKEPVSLTSSTAIGNASRYDRDSRSDSNSDTVALMTHPETHHQPQAYGQLPYQANNTQLHQFAPSFGFFPNSRQQPMPHHHPGTLGNALLSGAPATSVSTPRSTSLTLPSNPNSSATNNIPALETQLIRLRQYSEEVLSLSLYDSHKLLQDEIQRLEGTLLLAKKDRSERVLRNLEAEFPTLRNIHEGLKREATRLGYL
ncbi:ZZ type zinc finger protein [Nannizzia gypsea CBS 118893]|uniref:ZZ type zinc finger protein n=1 Tax=Arthroderma gypseum (strain ATCC MYA-4604 / CBS 118893) TaxID=535722 RepID=E4UQ72_ARTGP|nr:ZZ type zinc finger protein [Nannizzia gypsea CBS 118893]EFQ99991.1 ZZ type zinc finger protein [Nannizzia gypsea CBS 118893]